MDIGSTVSKEVTLLEMMKARDGDVVRIRLAKGKYVFAQIFGQGQFLAFFDFCGHGLWRLMSYDFSRTPMRCHSKASTQEQCGHVRRTEGAFWLVEDELRAHFLDMPPQGFTNDVNEFLLSLVPGIPAVIGEFGSLNNDFAYGWLKYSLEIDIGLSALENALRHFYSDEGLTEEQGCIMLAASEIVLALLGKGRGGVDTFAKDWLQTVKGRKLHQTREARVLLPDAIRAIDCVLCEHSGLMAKMCDNEGMPNQQWINGVLDLKDRLERLYHHQ